MRYQRFLTAAGVLTFSQLLAAGEPSVPPQVCLFSCDITPPVGSPMAGGLLGSVKGIEASLEAKGVVLTDGQDRFVLCALDWCRLHNGAYGLFRARLAAVAGTSESRVAVHCLHQHDSVLADLDAQQLLGREPSSPRQLDTEFLHQAVERVAAAARSALARRRDFTHVGYGMGKVQDFASTRRVRTADGKIRVRSSFTKDASLHAAPEGCIDPWLRTVTLYDKAHPLVRLHYYACHPQNNYGDGLVDPDVFGPVRPRMEKEEGVPQIYFAGCGGDVTVGKYNVGTPADVRRQLVARLCDGIRQAIAATQRVPISKIAWEVTEVRLPPRRDAALSDEALRARMADPAKANEDRIKASWPLAYRERLHTKPAIELTCLQLGPVSILHLPGEPFVEYQLYAQRARPNGFVAVAGCGDGGPGYICTDKAFDEGGYEPTVSWVAPATEVILKTAIDRVVR